MRNTDDAHIRFRLGVVTVTASVTGLVSFVTGPSLATAVIALVLSMMVFDWLRVSCFSSHDTPRSDLALFEAQLAGVCLYVLVTGIGFHTTLTDFLH